MGKRAWRVRRGDLLVGGRGLVVVVVAAFGIGVGCGRLLRRDERNARGVGRVGGCDCKCGGGIGLGREARKGGF